jgi:hypothetical protein
LIDSDIACSANQINTRLTKGVTALNGTPGGHYLHRIAGGTGSSSEGVRNLGNNTKATRVGKPINVPWNIPILQGGRAGCSASAGIERQCWTRARCVVERNKREVVLCTIISLIIQHAQPSVLSRIGRSDSNRSLKDRLVSRPIRIRTGG